MERGSVMSMPIPLDSEHGRQIWRDNILSDKLHPDACTRFFCVHTRDLLLEAFNVMDSMQARAEQAILEREDIADRLETAMRQIKYYREQAEASKELAAQLQQGFMTQSEAKAMLAEGDV
jgi:hypothetical protein